MDTAASAVRLPLYTAETNEFVFCGLCPNRCKIKSGYFGACGVRGSKNGKGIIPFYGFITSLAVDPIEKKPLYHFKSGSKILSLGFAGCNLRCPFCQNWHISQNTNAPGKWMKPEEIMSAALKQNTPSIAYTYSEPLIHFEYILDCMTLARRHGIANVLVTNGCINTSPAAEVLKLTDAANVDLKCFSSDTYKNCLNGGISPPDCKHGTEPENSILQTVLEFIKLCCKTGVHTEITTLVVPGLNDSEEELDKIADFIASLTAEPGCSGIPWHLTAYHPDYRWNAPPTNADFLIKAANAARKKLPFVYTGNIQST